MNVNPLLATFLLISSAPFVLSEELTKREFGETTFVYFPAGTCKCEILTLDGHHVDGFKKTITVSSFWLATTEVTVGEFKKFCDATSYETEPESGKARGSGYVPEIWLPVKDSLTWKAPGFDQTNDCPVTCVTYGDIELYCEWLTKQSTHTFRLPNMAEWQYAYLYGADSQSDVDGDLVEYVNLADRALVDYEINTDKALGRIGKKKRPGETDRNDGFVFTAPVRAKKARRNGLHFMHGNVQEVCEVLHELINDSFALRPELKHFVICGGSWLSTFERTPEHLSSLMPSGSASNMRGFRLVCVPKGE